MNDNSNEQYIKEMEKNSKLFEEKMYKLYQNNSTNNDQNDDDFDIDNLMKITKLIKLKIIEKKLLMKNIIITKMKIS